MNEGLSEPGAFTWAIKHQPGACSWEEVGFVVRPSCPPSSAPSPLTVRAVPESSRCDGLSAPQPATPHQGAGMLAGRRTKKHLNPRSWEKVYKCIKSDLLIQGWEEGLPSEEKGENLGLKQSTHHHPYPRNQRGRRRLISNRRRWARACRTAPKVQAAPASSRGRSRFTSLETL